MKEGKSVGAIIRDAEGRYLVQYRLKEPIGLALPAGHINEGESPASSIQREVLEETGLVVKFSSQVFHMTLPTACYKGHNRHEWWVYNVEAEGEPRLVEHSKHRFVKFMSPQEMQPYIKRGEVDPAWFKYILPALGII
jgi:ADP-ribose pyrophosphatase YjhB (NUDIX family)